MKTRTLPGRLVCLGSIVLLPGHVLSQDKDKQPTGQTPPAWMKYAQPGKFHEHLQPLVGRWKQEVKWWQAPGTPPQVSTSTCEYKWILGGRFLRQRVEGDGGVEGQTFEGLGIIGYDNFKKKYTSMWIDNMGTGIMHSLGTCDPTGKTITMVGRYDDVFGGKTDQTFRTVTRIVGRDRHIGEMYMVGPDGKEFKTLEITYTRE